MKEIDFQRKICKRVEEQGGFGRKWSSEFQAGPPDLVLSHSMLNGAFFMEVKLITKPPNEYDRIIKVTELQREHLRNLHKAGSLVCVGLVHYFPRRFWDLILLPWNVDRFKFNFEDQRAGEYCFSREDLVHNVKDHMRLDVVRLAHDFFGNN